MFDRGAGAPLVVIPGIQGRWEWMRPVLRVLARDFRVLSFSLCGDFGSGMRMDPALGFECFVRQLDMVLDRAGVASAAVCGISFGGVIAARYAAARAERVRQLCLVSAPGPHWAPSERQAQYAAKPWLSIPAFCATALRRLGPEIAAALPDARSRLRFTASYLAGAVAAPMLPHLMARRVALQRQLDLSPDLARIDVPTLVVTGEPGLDRVVPVESTREYVSGIRGARYAMMQGTGHLGSITQPERFARIVKEFIASHP